jgi:iron complex outermembrane receptor protein
MKSWCILLFFLFFSYVFSSSAQQSRYKIRVQDFSHVPIPGVLVALDDSVHTQWATTDSSGLAYFDDPSCQTCVVHCRMLGYRELDTMIHLRDSKVLNLILYPVSRNLKLVEIRSSRPLITSSHEKIIVNWEQLSAFTKGETVWDLLKQTPLVHIEGDEHIDLLHKSVIIYLNGKKQLMPLTALVSLLKNTPANKIIKFEVIPIPTADYDVSPGQAVINIVLKKELTDHLDGQTMLTALQNSYMNPSCNLQLSGKLGKFSFIQTDFLQLSGGRDVFTEDYDEKLTTYHTREKEIRSRKNTKFAGTNWYLNADIDTQQQVSFNFSYVYNWVAPANQEDANFYYYSGNDPKDTPDSTGYTHTASNEKSGNLSLALNYSSSLMHGRLGLDVNAGFIQYYDNTDQYTMNVVNKLAQVDTPLHILQSVRQRVRDTSIFVKGKYKLSPQFTISSGASIYLTGNDNNLIWYTYMTDAYVMDPNQSYLYRYTEHLFLPFLNLDGQIGKKFSFTVGSKYQFEDVSGKLNGNSTLNRKPRNLVPTVILDFNWNENNQLNYSLTSFINRPDFWELSPLRNYFSSNQYVDNNPYLRSSNNVTHMLRYTFYQKHQFILSYSNNKHDWGQYVIFKPNHGINLTRVNFAYTQNMGLYYLSQFSFLNHHIQINPAIGVEQNRTKGQDTILANYARWDIVAQCHSYFLISASHQWSAELNIGYRSRSVSGIYDVDGILLADLSIKKSFKRWNVYLQITDPLKVNTLHTQVLTPLLYNMKFTSNYDSRYVLLRVNYMFWNHQIHVDKKSSVIDEINNRLGH